MISDHPSLAGLYGMLPGDGVDLETMQRTYDKVLQTWPRYKWGWDYGMVAMAAGWDGCLEGNAPGFPDDGSWTVKWNGLKKAPSLQETGVPPKPKAGERRPHAAPPTGDAAPTTPTALGKPAAKTVAPKREASAEALETWEAKTRERLAQGLKEKGKPRFETEALGAQAAILAQDEKGLKVLLDKGGQTEMPWNQLGRGEYRSLALHLAAACDTPADHALAAFQLLCDGEEKKASRHLQKAGPEAAAEVRAAFPAQPAGESARKAEGN